MSRLRVLIAHNRYRLAGGEERHVDLLEKGLSEAGIDVRRFERNSNELADSSRRRALAGLGLAYRPGGGGIGEVLDEWSPDIVHFHNIWPQLTPAALRLARRSGAAVVLTIHNYRFACPSGTLYDKGRTHFDCIEGSSLVCSIRHRRGGLAESLAYGVALEAHRRLHMLSRWVDVFVAPSAFMADVLVRAGLPRARIHIIPNGLPIGSSPGPIGHTALYFGRLSEEKGIRTLLEAADRAPDVPVVIAGAGPLESRVRDARVEYVGPLDQIGLAKELERAAFTLVPSECYDNQPFAALEALGAGRGVIASRIGGLPEIVNNGNGILVPPRAPEELAAALVKLTRDRVLAERLGQNAFRDASSRFRHEKHVNRVVALYATSARIQQGLCSDT